MLAEKIVLRQALSGVGRMESLQNQILIACEASNVAVVDHKGKRIVLHHLKIEDDGLTELLSLLLLI